MLKMAEHSSYETNNMAPNLGNDQKFRLNRISKIRDYFVAELKREN